jgi:hypothetical protein
MARPKTLRAPAHLSPNPPLPKPRESALPDKPIGEEEKPDPTRYGDWEKKGVAVDF